MTQQKASKVPNRMSRFETNLSAGEDIIDAAARDNFSVERPSANPIMDTVFKSQELNQIKKEKQKVGTVRVSDEQQF
jgi:hypothetical protein